MLNYANLIGSGVECISKCMAPDSSAGSPCIESRLAFSKSVAYVVIDIPAFDKTIVGPKIRKVGPYVFITAGRRPLRTISMGAM